MAKCREYDFFSDSVEKTAYLGEFIGKQLFSGAFVALIGELGSGKTVMAGGIARGLGIDLPITSPTYSIISEYPGCIPLYHFDVYRLQKKEELAGIGYWEYAEGDGVCLVEWADIFPGMLPVEYLSICLRYSGDNGRSIYVTACGDKYLELLEGLLHVYSGAGDIDAGSISGSGRK